MTAEGRTAPGRLRAEILASLAGWALAGAACLAYAAAVAAYAAATLAWLAVWTFAAGIRRLAGIEWRGGADR